MQIVNTFIRYGLLYSKAMQILNTFIRYGLFCSKAMQIVIIFIGIWLDFVFRLSASFKGKNNQE